MERTITFNHVPQEAVDYAFDQFEDRVQDERILADAVEDLLTNERIRVSYDTKTVMVEDTITDQILRHSMIEKLESMIREVRRGDNTDYTEEELKAARHRVNEAFEG